MSHLSQKVATYYGLAAVLCWSTVATAFKISLQYLTPVQLMLVASTVSIFMLVAWLAWQGKLPELLKQSKKVYAASMLFGFLNPTLYYFLLFEAYDRLPAQEAQALNYSWAIVMTFLAVPLLKQKLYWYDYLAAAMCYLGVVVIATRGDLLSMEFANQFGVILALLSTVVWAGYWIFNQKDDRDPILGLCLNFIFAIPMLIALAAFKGELAFVGVEWKGLFAGMYVGVFEMGLAFIFWLAAMKRAENTARLANLIFVSPFLSLVFIFLILGEAILPSTIMGLILIILGLVAQQWFTDKRTKTMLSNEG